MATVNKNFKIKQGLVVEGSTATVNGNQVLSETASDQYIIDLIGGETLITSVSNAFSVADGELSLNYSEIDPRYDAANSASQAQQAAEDYADGVAGQAQSAAEGYADTVAGQAYSNAQSYADGVAGQAQSAAESYADTVAGQAYSNAQSYADGVAGQAQSAAESTASGYVSTHNDLTTGVHGVTGDVVGTTDTQDISNKRVIDTLYFSDGVTVSEEGEIAVRAVSHDFDVQANLGDLHLKTVHTDGTTGSDVQITSTYGDILLNANGAAYYGSASAENEIATHGYVDNAISGLTWKQSVNLLSTTHVDISGDLVGTSIDSHEDFTTADNGYRILLTGQNISSQNGIYELLADGSVLNASRPADANSYDELIGAAVYVMEGTTYGSTSWVQGNHYITDFTGQTWTQFSGQGSVTAGEGITVDGLEVSIDRTTVDDWYDPAGAAANAQSAAEGYADTVAGQAYSNAQSYADGVAGQAQSAAEGYADGVAGQAYSNAQSYADGVAGQAYSNAQSYADGVAGQAQSAAEGYADGVAGQAYSNAQSYADGVAGQAYSNAQSYADTVAGQAQSNAESYAGSLVNDITNGTTPFTEINVNSFSTQTAIATTGLNDSLIHNLASTDGTVYRAAKAIVKFSDGTDTQISEIIATLDSSNNIAQTEYAIVTTNGILANPSFSYKGSSGALQLLVTVESGYTVSAAASITWIK
jgi:hypothetical protein